MLCVFGKSIDLSVRLIINHRSYSFPIRSDQVQSVQSGPVRPGPVRPDRVRSGQVRQGRTFLRLSSHSATMIICMRQTVSCWIRGPGGGGEEGHYLTLQHACTQSVSSNAVGTALFRFPFLSPPSWPGSYQTYLDHTTDPPSLRGTLHCT